MVLFVTQHEHDSWLFLQIWSPYFFHPKPNMTIISLSNLQTSWEGPGVVVKMKGRNPYVRELEGKDNARERRSLQLFEYN